MALPANLRGGGALNTFLQELVRALFDVDLEN
jgi:hypothetical protein